jgi:hypothetical protein
MITHQADLTHALCPSSKQSSFEHFVSFVATLRRSDGSYVYISVLLKASFSHVIVQEEI